jgi:adenylosuccinate lyase
MDFDTYQSPFSWRYGSTEMRAVWGEMNKRRTWRRIWVCLAEVQSEYGLVSVTQLQDLKAHQEEVDIERALQIEAEIKHDLMAELRTFAEQCPVGGGVLHLGATSMDIVDNADALRVRESLKLIHARLATLLQSFAKKIRLWAGLPTIAFTHLQPAEPTTVGYRLAFYAQDLLETWKTMGELIDGIRGKGFKGAVGTGAAIIDLLGDESFERFENRLSELLGMPFFRVTAQTYPRLQDFDVLNLLNRIGAVLYKFAFDLRFLQSPLVGEASEPFGKHQVGSSAMPFKRNPIQAEKIDSLARALSVMPQVAWGDAAHSLLERTLDDSANRRSLLPEAFLITDEILDTSHHVIDDLEMHTEAIARNVATYAPFAATERIMMAAVKKGADRQQVHEHLRVQAMAAWQEVVNGKSNPLVESLKEDPHILQWLTAEELVSLLDISAYVGIAAQRAVELADEVHRVVG